MTAYQVRPATAERWEELALVMGTRGDPSHCFCQYFHLRGKEWQESTSRTNRERLRVEVASAPVAPGLLAYAGSEPAGWCRVGPKASLTRMASSKASAPPAGEPDPEGMWAVVCFVVRPRFRRGGVAHALVEEAVAQAISRRATAVEAYPVDAAKKGSVSSAELYHGSLSLFLAHGFAEVRRPVPGRVVVRRLVWSRLSTPGP
ncbi:MAG: GNAT family N-acetyltransferase [Actinomycetota bacterium]